MERLKGKLKIIQEQVAAEKNDIARGELILQEQALKQKMMIEEINMLRGERDHILGRQDRAEEMSGLGTAAGNQKAVGTTDGDGMVDDRGSTVMQNDNYGNVPQAEG